MRLKTLRISNYRSFKDQTIEFDNYTVLVGPNGVGKSTVLSALNILFREKDNSPTDSAWLDEQDFHNGNTDDPVEIVATFSDLTDEAKADLQDYVRHDQLIVAAVAAYDKSLHRAEVKQYGERLGIADFAPFFKGLNDGEKVADLKEVYKAIREKGYDVPAGGTGPVMTESLRTYESNHIEDCVALRSADNFYGATKGKGKIDRYIQWVYVPAVKDAKAEQIESKNTALGRLLSRTVRAKTNFDEQVEKVRQQALQEYGLLLQDNQEALTEISNSLSKRLREWSHPDTSLKIVWSQDPDKAVRVDAPMAKAFAGEAGFEGDVSRLGHGLQRSFILAILHELAETNDEDFPTLLLGCEEPELYQHPPQARHLANVLVKISEGNTQVISTTHNPIFASGQRFESVRMFRRKQDKSIALSTATFKKFSELVAEATGEVPLKHEGVRAKIHQALLFSLSEMFFANRLIFVEGMEDFSYLMYYMQATDALDSLRARGANIVMTASKSGMVHAIAIAKCLEIPFYAIWDSDGHEENVARRAKHEKDNTSLLKLMGIEPQQAFPMNDVVEKNYTAWKDELSQRIKVDLGEDWIPLNNKACDACGHAPNINKNSTYISELIIAAFESNKSFPSLVALCAAIGDFANAEEN